MEEYPRSLREFDEQFATEQACRDYLFRLRWPEGFHCPRCSGSRYWPVRSTLLECGQCGHQTSVTAGTIFQDTRKPLTDWFRAGVAVDPAPYKSLVRCSVPAENLGEADHNL